MKGSSAWIMLPIVVCCFVTVRNYPIYLCLQPARHCRYLVRIHIDYMPCLWQPLGHLMITEFTSVLENCCKWRHLWVQYTESWHQFDDVTLTFVIKYWTQPKHVKLAASVSRLTKASIQHLKPGGKQCYYLYKISELTFKEKLLAILSVFYFLVKI